jgi:hypothetical protein
MRQQFMAGVGPRSDLRFFFRMPKTGGGTLVAGIRDNLGVKWLPEASHTVPTPSSDQLWLGGHLTFGLHLIYGAEPEYLTVLRDPIERLISEYFYHHQHRLPGIFIPDDEIVPAFIRMVEAAPHLNYYIHMFSDYCFDKESAAANSAAWNGDTATALDLISRRHKRRGFLVENVRFKQINVDDAFSRALRGLSLMRCIGFFDELGDVKKYLKQEYGLKVRLNRCLHKTAWKPRLRDLPGHIAGMLVRKTEADYEFVRKAREAPAAAFRQVKDMRLSAMPKRMLIRLPALAKRRWTMGKSARNQGTAGEQAF